MREQQQQQEHQLNGITLNGYIRTYLIFSTNEMERANCDTDCGLALIKSYIVYRYIFSRCISERV